MNTKLEKVQAAMEDREFVARIAAMEEAEEVQQAFAEKGVEFTLEEISYIANQVMNGNTDELDEEQLEAVAGGVDPVTVTVVICGLLKLGADAMAEYNKQRKAKGKKTIW